ncbi:RNA polymerase sigma-70 factor [Dyadobacter sp. LHD-138]|uniref:RNA polymerase sigma-70 factor n=1 Tax=Dyadobacter sp. LHD-138 TaxID=3071413 RepID=UPI0027E0993E|nr:RNA polymerase sigma-70 factor [Dyadobacter sp. LHD-138]MDQ6481306.1 RNA polymerase sigma-70 factor [Dyadobacter sp. LHD-138]
MRKYAELSDEDLLILFQEDGEGVFKEIYNRYWSQLYSAAYRRVKSREVSQEIVQDIFTSLWIHREELNVKTSLTGYLLTAVKYRVLNHIEKEMVRRNYRALILDMPDQSPNFTEEAVFYDDLNSRLELEVSQFSPKCKEVFELSRKSYKSNKEIADLMNISVKTVENHLTKALQILRVQFKEVMILVIYSQL